MIFRPVKALVIVPTGTVPSPDVIKANLVAAYASSDKLAVCYSVGTQSRTLHVQLSDPRSHDPSQYREDVYPLDAINFSIVR